MTNRTYTTADAVEDFLTTVCQGATYWAKIIEYSPSRIILTDAEEGDGKQHTIDTAALLAWAASPRPLALAAKMRDDYQAAAIAGLATLLSGGDVDWTDVDYDADTADIIAQDLIFGELVYG